MEAFENACDEIYTLLVGLVIPIVIDSITGRKSNVIFVKKVF